MNIENPLASYIQVDGLPLPPQSTITVASRITEIERIPRRICIDLLTPPEVTLYKALQAIEEAGADPLLTDAVVLIQQAREKVAEYIDRRLNEHKIG